VDIETTLLLFTTTCLGAIVVMAIVSKPQRGQTDTWARSALKLEACHSNVSSAADGRN
jgi:hypothetical protein